MMKILMMLLSMGLVRMKKIDGNKLFRANTMFYKKSWFGEWWGEYIRLGKYEKQENFTCKVGLHRKWNESAYWVSEYKAEKNTVSNVEMLKGDTVVCITKLHTYLERISARYICIHCLGNFSWSADVQMSWLK